MKFKLKFEVEVCSWSLKLKLNFSFNFKLQHFNFEFQLETSTSTWNFKLQLQTSTWVQKQIKISIFFKSYPRFVAAPVRCIVLFCLCGGPVTAPLRSSFWKCCKLLSPSISSFFFIYILLLWKHISRGFTCNCTVLFN